MDIPAIEKAFKGKLVGNKKMKHHVVQTLFAMPQHVIRYITENVWFVTSFDDAWAFTFTGDDFQHKHVIFLSDELLEQDIFQIHWTIAHEIGHVLLGHKNRFFEKFSKAKIAQQENQADAFAKKYTRFTQPEQ